MIPALSPQIGGLRVPTVGLVSLRSFTRISSTVFGILAVQLLGSPSFENVPRQGAKKVLFLDLDSRMEG